MPEWLDTLAPSDPRAIRSRADLRLVNRLMANDRLVSRPLETLLRRTSARTFVDLGAGDGRTLLRFARLHAWRWPGLAVHLVDRQPVVAAVTVQAYASLGWRAEVVEAEVFDFLARLPPASGAIVVANLFVHHFDGAQLRELLGAVSRCATGFVCCEPRRSRLALVFSRLLGLIGCNDVTRHDATASVHAGFRGRELAALWPHPSDWELDEGAAGPFSHRFVALATRG